MLLRRLFFVQHMTGRAVVVREREMLKDKQAPFFIANQRMDFLFFAFFGIWLTRANAPKHSHTFFFCHKGRWSSPFLPRDRWAQHTCNVCPGPRSSGKFSAWDATCQVAVGSQVIG